MGKGTITMETAGKCLYYYVTHHTCHANKHRQRLHRAATNVATPKAS